MLTRKEVEKRGLKEGKDYLYIGGVRYQVGDKFYRDDMEVVVKTIIDQTHFESERGSCWHTGMFDDYKCLHGKHMKPLEYDDRAMRNAEIRLRNKQIYNPDVYILHDGKKLEEVGECLFRYLHKTSRYISEINDNQIYRESSLCAAISHAFGKQSAEVMFALQNWGESGENAGSLLLDDNCEKIKYEGFEHTVVCSGKMEGTNDMVTLLKRHCEPAQQFALVRYLKQLESGEYIGDTVWEDINFNDAANTFYEYTGRSVERALKIESESEL